MKCITLTRKLLVAFLLLLFDFSGFAQLSKSTYAKSKELFTKNSINGFVKNVGQVSTIEGGDANMVLYTFTASDVDVFITNKGISYVYAHPLFATSLPLQSRKSKEKRLNDSTTVHKYAVERVDAILVDAFIDTSHVSIDYADKAAVFNFYSSKVQITSEKLIKKITFKNVYPNIDWVIYNGSKDGTARIKYDFVINKGGKADNIKIKYSPNVTITVKKDSSLVVKSRFGYISEGRPIAFNGTNRRNKTGITYSVNRNIVRYDLNTFPIRYPFTIDPDLYWGTFLHTLTAFTGLNASTVQGTDIEADTKGNIYVALNVSGRIGFPTLNPGNGAYYKEVYDSANGNDVFMKFNEKGVLLWSTYFSSGSKLSVEDPVITVDNSGNLIVASAYSKNLPLKNNGGYFDTSINNGLVKERYFAKFSSDGILIWCTPWSYFDLMFTDITHDNEDNFYATGYTTHLALPIKDPGNGAYIAAISSGYHPFVCKFNKDCSLIWSTDIPGSDDADVSRIAVDKYKNVYILGNTVRYTKFLIG